MGGDQEFLGFMSRIVGQRVILVASFGDVAEKFDSDYTFEMNFLKALVSLQCIVILHSYWLKGI